MDHTSALINAPEEFISVELLLHGFEDILDARADFKTSRKRNISPHGFRYFPKRDVYKFEQNFVLRTKDNSLFLMETDRRTRIESMLRRRCSADYC